MKVGLEQRAGTRQTSPVNDCWPVTLVPAVSEIPSGAGGTISPRVTGLLWNPAHSLAVLLAAASSRGNELYLSAFKSVCFKDDLPHLTITEFPKFSLRYCCCYVSCAVQSSASAAARRRSPSPGVPQVALGTRWRSSRAASPCSPVARDVSGDTETFWLKGRGKQSCNPFLQEHQHTTELGLLSLVKQEQTQSWKHSVKSFQLFFFPCFVFFLTIFWSW